MRHKQDAGNEHSPTLAELLGTPVNNKQVRRILEFCHPLALFVEIDEQGTYQIIGVPGVPGHFQIGTLDKQKEWTPALDQQAFVWQTRQEYQGYLHFISRCEVPKTGAVSLVQHHPTYVRKGKSQVLQDIHRVLVTPLWKDGHANGTRNERTAKPASYEVGHTYRCILTVPCTCDIYLSLEQTRTYQWGTR